MYNDKQKANIMKWRETHLDEYREYQRIYAKENYNSNYGKVKEKKRQYYLANKEKKRQYYLANRDKMKRNRELKEVLQEFMNILLE